MKRGKGLGLVRILDLIRSGKSPSKISKDFNIPKQTIDYSLVKLKKMGCIRKKGYGVWEFVMPLKEVPNLTITHSDRSIGTSNKKKEIRGHAFIWKIQFYEQIDWERAVRSYHKSKLKFQLMKHNKILRTIFKNRKIWLGKKGMIIYEPIDFLGRSSFEVKGHAVFEMDLLIKDFLQELGLKFRPYKFTTSREHYGIIKNELARQYNEKKEKMEIKSADGDVWMWIDDSKSLGELENNAPVVNRQVQSFWNDHKDHGFKIDASFVLNGLNKLSEANRINAEHLEFHAENMRTHVKAVQDLADAVNKLTDKVEQLDTHTK
jgi:hypothetical protein